MEQLTKRTKKLYSDHFPELAGLIDDDLLFIQLVKEIGKFFLLSFFFVILIIFLIPKKEEIRGSKHFNLDSLQDNYSISTETNTQIMKAMNNSKGNQVSLSINLEDLILKFLK